MAPLRERLRELSERYLTQGLERYQLRRPKVEVRCDLRGQSAGQIKRLSPRHFVVRYNLAIAQQQADAFLAETVPHEIAHLLVWLRFADKARPHGPEWQQVMRDLGVRDPQRCHSFTVPSQSTRQQQRWDYRCDCQQHQLSTTRHKRAQAGQMYVCRKCRQPLSLATQANT